MKILVYPHDLNMGGSQTNAIELAAAVSRRGHECIVFGRRGSLCERIEELGLEFIESPDPGRRPSPRVARALRAIIRERGIDVVHGYEWPPGLEAVLAAGRSTDVAAVCTVMSMAVAPFLPRWLPMVVGTQQISAVEQAGGRSDVNLIEPPVDLEHNRPFDAATVAAFRREWGLDDRPLLVCVSRLVPELKLEGILTAIDTAVALSGVAPFQLLIVGDGKARPEVERRTALANTEIGRRTVVLTGELADPRVAYSTADVVMGMGGSALRSLAFGKPLVVQGERGFFASLTPQTVELFRWQGWYGVGDGSHQGGAALTTELMPLLVDPGLRRERGAYGRHVVEEFSLERAAERQVTVYRDALSAAAGRRTDLVEAGRAFRELATYHVEQRLARYRGRQHTDDFNAVPASAGAKQRRVGEALDDLTAPILYFPGVGWDTLAGTDRQLVTALARNVPVVWVDTPHSILRRRDRLLPAVSHPLPNVVRLRASTLVGVQRPLLRGVANRRRAQVATRYLARNGMRPRAVIASTTAPMLGLVDNVPGTRVYYATDDFVAAAGLWGVSRTYLAAAREENLAHADLVLAVTPELARHLQRGPQAPSWLPNGADLTRFADLDSVDPAPVPLERPIVGVVGQFNSRTDLGLLEDVLHAGSNLLLVGPRWFSSDAEDEVFDRLVGMPAVHWVDELPREELLPYLKALDVGLTPYKDSMFNRRSYPLKTLEYLAAGVPVVTTDVASPTGLDGRYVTVESNPEGFCRRIDKVVHARRDPSAIRRSVASDGWDSRAAQLLSWLAVDTHRPGSMETESEARLATHRVGARGSRG